MSKEIKYLSQPAEVSMADEWFEIANKDHFWMEWRFRIIQRLLSQTNILGKGARYLEIGCGHGQFLQQCDERLNDIVVDGCDLNLFALQKITSSKGSIFVYNIFDAPGNMLRRYAGVFLLDVIEHIDDDAAFVRKAIEHIHSDGVVVINVPALSSLFSKYDIVAGHKRRYTRQQMAELFQKCNLEPLHIGYWGFSLLPTAFVRKLYLSFISKEKVISKGFSPGYGWINFLFKLLMKFELMLFQSPPLGTSVVAIGKVKTASR